MAPSELYSPELYSLEPIVVLAGTKGIYVSQFADGNVKIGSSDDIAERHATDPAFKGARVLALLPGWRGVEGDLHARFRAFRCYEEPRPYFRETYFPVGPVRAFVEEARALGFTPEDLGRAVWMGARQLLRFDSETFFFEATYAPFIERGSFFPRYILESKCERCGYVKNSLEFLNSSAVEKIGRRTYLVLNATEVCSLCKPVVFPKKDAFRGDEETATIRIGRLRARSGEWVQAYDRDRSVWMPLVDMGVRRMAKKGRARPGQEGEDFVLRFQPSRSRDGKAQGKT